MPWKGVSSGRSYIQYGATRNCTSNPDFASLSVIGEYRQTSGIPWRERDFGGFSSSTSSWVVVKVDNSCAPAGRYGHRSYMESEAFHYNLVSAAKGGPIASIVC
jgi:hypothetical protein